MTEEQQGTERLKQAFRGAVNKTRLLEKQLEEFRHGISEPIAIVSASCRLPGGVASMDDLWTLLDSGTDAITQVPSERWDMEGLYHPDRTQKGRSYARGGGFLSGLENFDAGFFGISPKEAVSIDPQQRLLLETAWETFENAGIPPKSLSGSKTGVYVGTIVSEYAWRLMTDLNAIDAYGGLVINCINAGRLSYWFGLKGPNFPIDTACSSSLVAMHLACQGLRNKECEQALVGGVNVILEPAGYIFHSRLNSLSPTDRCHTFSADADGYVRAEGCGMVLLKRLSDARRDGDSILALISGSAVNHDGRTNGLTAPNGLAQEAVIRDALQNAGIGPETVDAMECHGTGTSLGDPIEVQALNKVYGVAREESDPLLIGSLKSNIGHAEGAAGIAGLLKAVLSVQKGRIPKSLHFDTPNPNIQWDKLNVQVASKNTEWKPSEHPRRMGVSSFGFSGTNAHVIVEEPPAPTEADEQTGLCLPIPLQISGRDEGALREIAQSWANWLQDNPQAAWPDLIRTALHHRTHFEERCSLQVNGTSEAIETLRAVARGEASALVQRGSVMTRPKLAMLFTGQGSQSLKMGQALHDTPGFEAFTKAFDAAIEACQPHLENTLLDVIWNHEDSKLLDRTDYTQPALFALETALFRQWEAWGVVPHFLLGHSVGEIVAAHVAGVFSLEDAAKLVCGRGRLMVEQAQGGGHMASIQATEEEVVSEMAALPESLRSEISIAGLNTPHQTVISGSGETVAMLKALFEGQGRKVRALTVSHAFHSSHMEPMLDAFRELAQSIEYRHPSKTVVSNVTGKIAVPEAGDLVGADYWVRHVREAVRFSSGAQAVYAAGARLFVECGPQAILSAMVSQCLKTEDGFSTATSLRKSSSEVPSMMQALGQLHVNGARIEWSNFIEPARNKVLGLPNYPFQRKRHWVDELAFSPTTQSELSDLPIWDFVSKEDIPGLAKLLQISDDEKNHLAAILPRLNAWHQRTHTETTTSQWRYKQVWTNCPKISAPSISNVSCLILADGPDDAWAQALAAVLKEKGAGIQVQTPEKFLDRAINGEEKSPSVVISVVSPGKWQTIGVQALKIAQSVTSTTSGRLWFLTPHTLRVSKDDVPSNASLQILWGLGRSIMLATPQHFGGLIDLCSEPVDGTPLDQLAHILLADSPAKHEDELAVREDKLLVRRLHRAGPGRSSEGDWEPKAPCLVTGGTNGLGLELALRLAQKGAKQLVLASRRGKVSDGQEHMLAAMTDTGCKVETVSCDVSDASAVDALIGSLAKDASSLNVFHAAGHGSTLPFEEETADTFAQETAGKVEGAWNLHHSLERYQVEVDRFFLFSSISCLWGSASLVCYAAANAGLDGLYQHRIAHAQSATLIHWGPWDDIGMVKEEGRTQFRKRGLRPMKPEHAMEALFQNLGKEDAHQVVVDIDWRLFFKSLTSAREKPLLNSLAEAHSLEHQAESFDEPAAALKLELEKRPDTERQPTLLEALSGEFAMVLGHTEGRLPPETGFMDMGLDSLMAVDVRRRIAWLTGVSIPATITFDQPNLLALSQWLLDEMFPQHDAVEAALAVLSGLSEEQLQDERLVPYLRAGADLDGTMDELDDALAFFENTDLEGV